jgi:hypothetical protein
VEVIKPTMFDLTPPVKTIEVNIKCVGLIEVKLEMFISAPPVKTRGVSANILGRTRDFGAKITGNTKIFGNKYSGLHGNSF